MVNEPDGNSDRKEFSVGNLFVEYVRILRVSAFTYPKKRYTDDTNAGVDVSVSLFFLH